MKLFRKDRFKHEKKSLNSWNWNISKYKFIYIYIYIYMY